MSKYYLGRYLFSEITPLRVLAASKTRFQEIPHYFSWKFQKSSRINQEKICKYKDIYKGERCFIVANGPSILNTNLDLLIKEKSFGLNRIYLRFPSITFRPTYFVAVNELILEQFSNEIQNLEMPKFLNWNRRSFFNPLDPKNTFLKSKMVITDSFQIDLSNPMVFGATVTFVALQLAYYMGFQQVILVGLDHNYKEKGIPSKTETRISENDESHFDSQYFPKGAKWQLPDLLRSEKEFEIARKIYEQDGREILDATLGGKCHIFKKVEFTSLFPK